MARFRWDLTAIAIFFQSVKHKGIFGKQNTDAFEPSSEWICENGMSVITAFALGC